MISFGFFLQLRLKFLKHVALLQIKTEAFRHPKNQDQDAKSWFIVFSGNLQLGLARKLSLGCSFYKQRVDLVL